jgi:uncharacterized C2H2 Zn-finger protein
MKIHEGEPKFTCDLCGKSVRFEKKLREHIAVVHTREMLFKCRVTECGKGFRAEGNWKQHEKKAHPEEYEKFFKPFWLRGPNE